MNECIMLIFSIFVAVSDIFRNFKEYGLASPEIIRMDTAAWVDNNNTPFVMSLIVLYFLSCPSLFSLF